MGLAMTHTAPKRAQDIRFGAIDPDLFLSLVAEHGSTTAAGGQIKSQYADQLRAKDRKVGIHALYACDQLVGALSYGVVSLPRISGTVSGRIDVVLTLPQHRGRGIASLLMAHYIIDACETHGPSLRHLSVIAQHPAIAEIARGLGYHRAGSDNPPVHIQDVELSQRDALHTQASRVFTERMGRLRRECINCVRIRLLKPWCMGSDKVETT